MIDNDDWNLFKVLLFCRRVSKVEAPDEIHFVTFFCTSLLIRSASIVKDLASLPNLKALDFSDSDMDVEFAHELVQRNLLIRYAHQICFQIQDNNTDSETALENKDYVKFLGVVIDKHLTWKKLIDYNSSKISKIIGPIARLRHHVPFKNLRPRPHEDDFKRKR